MLLSGCLIGIVCGPGRSIPDRWLAGAHPGSSVQFTPAWKLGLTTLVIVLAISLVASLIAVLRISGVQPKTAFATERASA